MRARTNPMGLTETTLVLPAAWREALVSGNDSRLPVFDLFVIINVLGDFGECIISYGTPEHRDDHDAIADGVAPAECISYVFVGE